ncbi:hypothetical protein N7539_000313 [Penicillium diatomitis]|uniref:CHAT domain-containing protein n=1 Tax=Penicillium diatomitis TaxID=2819901 RepID=A0A9W9XLF8_9EURO|nr:uncharacterized protein N7539_000313 [Penicillium diatomitis]KAJ5495197.1 hypothetical protein N7539_000313 [Penicillium diatomitis]
MDCDHFIGLCGRSLFAEEYRGDLDAAEDYLHQMRPDETTSDLTIHAEHLRCSAVLASLKGRPADAYKSLSKLSVLLDRLPKEWGLRYANYKALNDYTRRFPPLIRFYHENGKPVDISMLANVPTPGEMTKSFMEDSIKFADASLPRDQSSSLVLNAVMGIPWRIRNLAYTFHPLSPRNPTEASRENLLEEVSKSCEYFAKFRDTADSQGSTGVGTYLLRLTVEVHLACQSPLAETFLQGLYERCELLGDTAGMANAKMMEADSLMSPPFASPLTLNMIIADVTTSTMTDVLWSPVESRLRHDYPQLVRDMHEKALELFRQSNSKRGQAAVLLRQGCCLHDQGRHERLHGREITNVLKEAKQKLEQSLKLFGVDEANTHLTKTHVILLEISRGSHGRVKAMAKSIGHWGTEAQNEITTHFLGMLMCRYAHQEWFKFSNLDNAILAWECASEVFKPLGDMIPLYQSLVSRASAQYDMFNIDASQILLEKALAKVDGLLEYFDGIISAIPDDPLGNIDRSTLMTGKFQLLSTLDSVMSQSFRLSESLEKFNEWRAKYVRLLENDESFIAFRESLENGEMIRVTHEMLPLPEARVKGLWRQSLAETAANVRYTSAEVTFRRLLGEGDIKKAEREFRRFIDDTDNEGTYVDNFYRVLACQLIGDLGKAREIFDSMTDDDIFRNQLNDLQQGVGVKEFFDAIGVNAITFAVFAGDQERARKFIDLILEIQPHFFDRMDDDAMGFAHRISSFGQIMSQEQPEVCFAKLLEAYRILETRRVQTKDLDARISSSNLGWAPDVYANLARLCLRWQKEEKPISFLSMYEHGHFDNISWDEHALLFVEMSRARSVLESIQTQAKGIHPKNDSSDMTPLSEAIYKRRLLRSLLAQSQLSPEQEAEASQLRREIDDLEKDGKLSNTTSFIEKVDTMTEPRLLFQSIDKGALVLEASFTPRGHISFAITCDGIAGTHQGTTNTTSMRRLAMQAMQILQNLTGDISPGEESRKTELSSLTKQISAILLEPFAEIIESKKHVIFSVSDPMTAFAFACLPFNGKPLVAHAAVSQVPSLTVLYHLSQRKSVSETPTVSVIAKSPVENTAVGADRTQQEDNLYMAGIEAVAIARAFNTKPIEASHMTREEFRKHVQGGSLVMHVGTHGTLNHRWPLLSSISIGDGEPFRVIDMSAIRSNVHLLVFAACLSGLGKATFTSEVLGFSHVVLSTGCQAYIGSLWKVSDFASMMIMTLFYRHLRATPHLSIANLMQKAQMEVMKLNDESAGMLLNTIMENWSYRDASGYSPEDFVPHAEFWILMMRMRIADMDWTSPFFWAPFTLVGYGGLSFVHSN